MEDRFSHVDAAEILLDFKRLQPSVILAALRIDVFLRSFLATGYVKGYVKTAQGHELTDLLSQINGQDRNQIRSRFGQLDSTHDLCKAGEI